MSYPTGPMPHHTVLQRIRIRRRIVKWCEWGIAHEGLIHYAPVRPMPLPKPGTLPLTTDCSGYSTLVDFWSGAPDPNGNQPPYNGSGWSGAMAAHLQPIHNPKDLRRGDKIIFEDIVTGRTTHVADVIKRSRRGNPVLMSHGLERGPLRITLDNERSYHPGERVLMCSLFWRNDLRLRLPSGP